MIAFCLHKAIKFNVGKLLHRELIALKNKPKGPLFFPGLVQQLCALANISPDEGDVTEARGSYDLHSLRRILMGSVDCPKTKKEREEEDRARLRREIKKGKQPAVQEKKKTVAVSRKRHHVVIQEPSVNSPGEHRVDSASPSSSSIDLPVPQEKETHDEDHVPPHSENSEINPAVEGATSTTMQVSPVVRDELPAVSTQMVVEDHAANDYAFMESLFAGPCRSDPLPSFTFGQDSNSGRESADNLRRFVDQNDATPQQTAAQSAEAQKKAEASRLEEERRHMKLPTPLGRFLTNEEMTRIQANSATYMLPGANFQNPEPGEPAFPEYTPEQPTVRVETEPSAPLPTQTASERKAYQQGFEHGQRRMIEALRWEVVKPITETVKAMQQKIDLFMTAYTHNETIFNMRCTGSTTDEYSAIEKILLQPTPYPDLGPFHPPPHYGVPPPPQDQDEDPAEDNTSNPNV